VNPPVIARASHRLVPPDEHEHRFAKAALCAYDKFGAAFARREVYISEKEGSMGDC
jgi:hypothetical protein